MENESKSSKSRAWDRLSELHDSLIFNIFEFLPMNDIVRTRIRSHRWKNLWTLTPFLYFQNEDLNNITFRSFVNRALLSWRGTRVQKFKVSGIANENRRSYDPLFSDIDSWLRFALYNGVEELDISFKGILYAGTKHYCVPPKLYSCSSLKRLLFSGCNIEITGKAVQWNQLLSLTIQGFEITARTVKQILRGSPRLEFFNLHLEESDDNVMLNFRSSSLKVLLISKILGEYRPSMDAELRIWTPNLKSLTIEGLPYGNCLLKNVSSLTHVTLWFREADDFDYSASDDSGESDDLCDNYLEATLSQILPTIQHVEGLTLSAWSIEELLNMNCKSLLSTFPNVKFLSFNGKFGEPVYILGLLEIFPKLETLVVKEEFYVESKLLDFKWNPPSWCEHRTMEFYVESEQEFKWNPSMYFLDELRTIEVTWNQCDFSIFPLIESLLKYARKLERMVVRVKEIEPPSSPAPPISLFLASKELCKIPRSSPTAKLIICEN